MKTFSLVSWFLWVGSLTVNAHLIGEASHDQGAPHYDFSVKPPTTVLAPFQLKPGTVLLAQATPSTAKSGASEKSAPKIAATFQPFAPKVKTRWDEQFLYVESDGMPAHDMMVGISNWQQQVPLPQPYTGNNAWRVPLHPMPSPNPVSIKGRFLRGAIALAANGIPIFNPQNNRGEVSQEIGELDQWGGHCGRADDYHYHAAPLHLQSVLGKDLPIAYALDGYPLYGLAEPDGSTPTGLDAFNGHTTPALGYHYHGSTKYPYVNGGFYGVVTERDGQVDPQPRAQPMREALPPLRGARITGFTNRNDKNFSLQYQLGRETRYVNYTLNGDRSTTFVYVDGSGQQNTQTYSGRGGDRPLEDPNVKGGRKKNDGKGKQGPGRAQGPSGPPLIINAKHSGNFLLQSSVVADGAALPLEFTGDGAGVSPPIEWKGAPAATKSFAVVMDHLAPGNDMKCYWTVWDIPATVASLPKNSRDIGKLGTGFKGETGYEPPHSQGPGLKTYVIHVYALSDAPKLNQPQREVTREVLLNAIKDIILDSAELKVTYTKPGGGSEAPPDKKR